MADNRALPAAAGKVASDETTYSGDADAHVQLLRLVDVSGAEGSKTVESVWSRLVASNSSTAVLGAAASFTGTSTECIDFAEIAVNVIASHASATDGLQIQQSSDGTNWDVVDSYTIAAATPKVFTVQVAARYFRVVYTNGGTLQTSFRLQSFLRRVASKGSSQRPADSLSNENDFQQVWSLGSLWDNAAGAWQRIRGTITGLFVQGGAAHDDPASGNPLQQGGYAVSHGASPTAVAATDATRLIANRHGVPFVMAGHPNTVSLELAITGALTDSAMITVSAGTKIVVTQATLTADNANTAFPQFRAGFGATTTPTTTGVVISHPGVPAGGGVVRGSGAGIVAVGGDGEDLRVTCGAPTGGSLRLLVSYYLIES